MRDWIGALLLVVLGVAGCGTTAVRSSGATVGARAIPGEMLAGAERQVGDDPYGGYSFSNDNYASFRYTVLSPTDETWDDGQGLTVHWRGTFPTTQVGTHIWDVGWSYIRYYPAAGTEEGEIRAVTVSVGKTFYRNFPVYLAGGLGLATLEHPTLGEHSGACVEGFIGTQFLIGNIDIALEGGYFAANPDDIKLDAIFWRVAVLFTY